MSFFLEFWNTNDVFLSFYFAMFLFVYFICNKKIRVLLIGWVFFLGSALTIQFFSWCITSLFPWYKNNFWYFWSPPFFGFFSYRDPAPPTSTKPVFTSSSLRDYIHGYFLYMYMFMDRFFRRLPYRSTSTSITFLPWIDNSGIIIGSIALRYSRKNK